MQENEVANPMKLPLRFQSYVVTSSKSRLEYFVADLIYWVERGKNALYTKMPHSVYRWERKKHSYDLKCKKVVAAIWQLKKHSSFLFKCIDLDLEEHGMGSKTSL